MAENKNNASGIMPSDLSMADLFKPTTPEELMAEKLVSIAQKQIEASNRHKRKRMDEVQKSIDLYEGRVKKALKGRYNVPLPLMSGYVDTLVSKVDDPPKVRFGYTDIADMQRSKKVQAKFDEDSGSTQGMWAAKDRLDKKIASFYGVGIKKYFAFNDSEGEYHSHLEVIDPLDFECEPMGGQFLSNHKFMGQRNIFKTEAELRSGATGDSPIYSKKQILKLIATVNSNDFKSFKKIYIEKSDRLRSLGFDPELNSYMGQKIYNLTEWYMEYDGRWYYLLMEPHSGTWVRFAPLKEIFESGKTPFEAWHTHPDPFNFWSKSPADDMRPIAESMNIIFNQALDNREKKTYAQRAYDPEIFTDPAQLEWRPDGLVEANTDGGARAIGSGIYEFKVGEMSEAGTINLMDFMDNMAGTKTGITPSTEGATQDKRVGIYYGNLQQVADRLGLYNKSYSEAWGRIGYLYYWGLKEHIKTNKMMVKMIGDSGYNWVELIEADLSPTREFEITISGGQSEIEQDELKKKQRSDSLAAVLAVPTLAGRLNPEVTIEEILRNGSYSEDTIKRFLNTNSAGSEDIISEAHQAIQNILQGKQPKRNRGADQLFLQTLNDFAMDSEDLSQEDFDKIMAYADDHLQIAAFNMVRKVQMDTMLAQMSAGVAGMGAPGNALASGGAMGGGAGAGTILNKTPSPTGIQNIPGSPTKGESTGFLDQPVPGTRQGTQARAAIASSALRP